MLNRYELIYWLSSLQTIGHERTEKLLEHFSSFEAVFSANEKELVEAVGQTPAEEILAGRKEYAIKKGYEAMEKRGIRLILDDEKDFPEKLLYIPEAPRYLYCLGKLPDRTMPAVAIVGSRGCSEYGRMLAREFAEGLAAEGVLIVSGLAEGIDSEAHKGALVRGGYTVGVIGNGIGGVYPQSNWQLFDALEERGCIISEYPPGRPAFRYNFPFRNRIISGLSDAVLVIEAREKSGTLHTVDHGLSQGREIFAVPGRLTDPMSLGCNSLIKQGAHLVTCVGDILFEAFGYETKKDAARTSFLRRREKFYKAHKDELTRTEWIVYGAIGCEPKSIDDICESTSLSLQEVAGALFKLCDKTFITDLGGCYVLRLM